MQCTAAKLQGRESLHVCSAMHLDCRSSWDTIYSASASVPVAVVLLFGFITLDLRCVRGDAKCNETALLLLMLHAIGCAATPAHSITC